MLRVVGIIFLAIAISLYAVSAGSLPSPTSVLTQTGAGFPLAWGSNDGKPVPAYYEMARSVIQDAATKEELLKGLRALPSVTLTPAMDDLFGAQKGIYSNPRQSGSEWERAADLQYFPTNGGEGFHVQCGVRIQGGWNRRPEPRLACPM